VHDPFTLFKILIVVLVVVYQGVQALRKRAKAASEPTVPPAPTYEPEPEPEPEREEARERIRTLVMGRAAPASIAAAPVSDTAMPAVVVSMNTAEPIRSLEPGAALGVPTLRDLVLAQVILSPPPGSRAGRRESRSPLELRR
jgi:hypothetical protein